MKPPACDHESVKIRDAQTVFGTPGRIFARYKCPKCHVEWDDPTEVPLDGGEQIWKAKDGL